MSKNTFLELSRKTCTFCTVLELDEQRIKNWRDGAYIQNVFPDLTPDQRELMMTGTCGECWDKMMGEQ